MDPFIGQIILFAGNFAPRGWALCDGQLMDINSNSALFSILGTTYGGDGRTTFGLPSLRGRVPIHAGHGPGLTPRPLGQKSGQENVTLTVNEIPSHHHIGGSAELHGNSGSADSEDVEGNVLGSSEIYSDQTPDAVLNANSVKNITTGHTGGNSSHNNMQPYLALNYIIALEGTYPSRS